MSILRFVLAAIVFVALYFCERKWPLRTFADPGLRRVGVNLDDTLWHWHWLLLSVPFRAIQVVSLGVAARSRDPSLA